MLPEQKKNPDSIVSPAIVLAPLTWDIDSDITRERREPPGCLSGTIYVPDNLQTRVIEWAHRSLASGHPGVSRTLSVISCKCWWLRMAGSVKTAVQSCAVCAMMMSLSQRPDGKLMPLPTPSRPWSHIVVDFVTDLPVS